MCQYGFRSERSCKDNLAILQENIHLNNIHNRDTPALFLDIEGAYNNVLGDILLNKLQAINLPSQVLNFVYNLIHCRMVSFKYGDLDEQRLCYKELPQGAVLSPVLYSIYVSDIEKSLVSSPNTRILQFADDICIFNSNSDTKSALQELQKSGKALCNSLSSKELTLAAHKSVLVIFSKNSASHKRKWKIIINETSIKCQNSVKFLGVIFQANCKWDQQVEKVLNACVNPSNLLVFLTSRWWGASPEVLLILYKALVRFRIEYASFIWSQIPKAKWKALEGIQNRNVRIAMGYRRSTPRNIILIESKIPPLHIRFVYLGCNFVTHCRSQSQHPLLPIMEEIRDQSNPTYVQKSLGSCLVRCFNVTEESCHLLDASCKSLVFNTEFDILMTHIEVSITEGLIISNSDNANLSFHELFSVNESEGWYFTDGSKSETFPFAGIAAISYSSQHTSLKRTSNIATIFTCEMLALIEALDLAKNENFINIFVFSDSQSALLAIKEANFVCSKKSYLIIEIKKRINALNKEGRTVKFFWIPAHVGISFNEKEDQAAKKACFSGLDSPFLIPRQDFSSRWKNNMVNDSFNWGQELSRSTPEGIGARYFVHYYPK